MTVEVTESLRQGVLLLQIATSRIDASNAPDFRLLLIERIEQGHGQIVIDLAQVEFMDSSALGALIAAVKRMGAIGSIALARPGPAVARLLSLTRMDKVFVITATVDDAMQKLGA